jgi:hypothetical protein
VYNNPLDPGVPDWQVLPTGFIKDYYSEAFTGSFDESGNLYMADLNRGRVLIYKQPFKLTIGIQDPDPDNSGLVHIADILKVNQSYSKKASAEWAGWYRYEGVDRCTAGVCTQVPTSEVAYDRVDLARDCANQVTIADPQVVTGNYMTNWPPNNLTVGKNIKFFIKATGPIGRDLGFSATATGGWPAGASFTNVSCEQGYFTWTPQTGQTGTRTFTFQVTDGTQTATTSVTITVL